MPEVQESEVERFRSSLEDTVEVLHKLQLHTLSVPEVIQMLELAINNDGQLRMLWSKFVRLKAIVQ